MALSNKKEPSEDSQKILQALKAAVTAALDKKRKLGQYYVKWDGSKCIRVGEDSHS